MDIVAVSGAATLALLASLPVVVLVRGWQVASDRVFVRHAVAGVVFNESSQANRDACRQAGRRQSSYLVGALAFALVFTVVILLQATPFIDDAPRWQVIALLLASGAAAGAGLYRFLLLVVQHRRIRLRRDAGIVTGHALQRLSASMNRCFHDVPCSAGTVDHVIVGLQGVYAVHVVARRSGKDRRVRLRDDEIHFAGRQPAASIAAFRKTADRLARELGKAAGHTVHVRCVVALPGFEISEQSDADVLLVNERNIAMLAGWRDQRDYLMDEDVALLQDLLGERCTRSTA